jgi:predicted ArsR family transcriptional regulator
LGFNKVAVKGKTMMTTQLERIERVLRKNGKKGVTAAQIANLAKVNVNAVYRRVSELSANLGITKSTKTINGRTKVFYKVA